MKISFITLGPDRAMIPSQLHVSWAMFWFHLITKYLIKNKKEKKNEKKKKKRRKKSWAMWIVSYIGSFIINSPLN